jgi:hypothetical protein
VKNSKSAITPSREVVLGLSIGVVGSATLTLFVLAVSRYCDPV